MILVILLYVLFASTFTLGKSVLQYVDPLLFIGIRMTLAGAILLLYHCCITKKSWFVKKEDISLFIRIIIFHIFCAYVLEFWALKYVTSAKACLLYNLSPFITAVFSYFLYAERLSYRQMIGLLIGFLAFIPILIAQTPLEAIGWHLSFLSCYELALIGSVISSAYGWMIVKKLHSKDYPLQFINGISMAGGGLLALFSSLWVEGVPHIKTSVVTMPFFVQSLGAAHEGWVVVAAYSLVLIFIANIIGYNLYGYLLSRYSATFLSFAGFMTPLFAALFGWIFLNEQVSWHFFATMVCVVFGLYLFHEKKQIIFEEKGL